MKNSTSKALILATTLIAGTLTTQACPEGCPTEGQQPRPQLQQRKQAYQQRQQLQAPRNRQAPVQQPRYGRPPLQQRQRYNAQQRPQQYAPPMGRQQRRPQYGKQRQQIPPLRQGIPQHTPRLQQYQQQAQHPGVLQKKVRRQAIKKNLLEKFDHDGDGKLSEQEKAELKRTAMERKQNWNEKRKAHQKRDPKSELAPDKPTPTPVEE